MHFWLKKQYSSKTHYLKIYVLTTEYIFIWISFLILVFQFNMRPCVYIIYISYYI